jgi:tRNA-Thr(GGU) m(6)t(6)A37 methyltransferase TsaA
MKSGDLVDNGVSGKSDRGTGQIRFIGVVEKETSKIRIFPEFRQGLDGLVSYSHIIIIYWFHLRDNQEQRGTLQVVPKRHPGAPQVGVFSSRSPSRPNPIGLCVVELVGIENCILTVKELDAVEGSPIVDIKPYLPRADSIPDARTPEWARGGPVT